MPLTAHLTTPDGTRIAYRDHTPPDGRAGRTVLLLHGLAGHMAEWDDLTARLLADGHRVVTYDARGHGVSTRTPADMTRAAAVSDATALIDHLHLAPVTLVGQSLGGLTALLVAASRHAPAVDSLVLVEAGPACRDPELPSRIGAWLDSWPPVFRTRTEALAFLGHEAWVRGLDEREDGWYPTLDRDTMVAAVAELATHDYWAQWSLITCPTLVVRGENGTMRESEAREMRTRRPSTTTTVIQDAAHDVHLDQPEALHETIARFLKA
jgi:pimeloyl-ACP methyl ester carboxylesterase